MKDEINNAIKHLASQATVREAKADEALKFTQAALNLAHVLQVQAQTESTED